MAAKSRYFVCLISLANVLIIILSIIIMCLSLGYWPDYTGCAFTILISILWTCCVCTENNVAISCYLVLMIIDMLIMLSNAIYQTVMCKKYSDFCFDLNEDKPSPEWGCHDWRTGHFHRTVGVIVCYFIAFGFRLSNIVSSCLLARSYYEAKNYPK